MSSSGSECAAAKNGKGVHHLTDPLLTPSPPPLSLKLKTSALDKFRLPIDVKEGYLGELTLSIPWSNLKGKPVRVLVENVHLLAAPKNASAEVDEEEEEERAQAAKQEKLANAELLGRDSGANVGMSAEEAQKNESFTSSLVTKIVDNLQITVKNIHVRYEDTLSNPEHPFSAGFTLAEFSAVSTDSNWNPTFVQNSAEGIHKVSMTASPAHTWHTFRGADKPTTHSTDSSLASSLSRYTGTPTPSPSPASPQTPPRANSASSSLAMAATRPTSTSSSPFRAPGVSSCAAR